MDIYWHKTDCSVHLSEVTELLWRLYEQDIDLNYQRSQAKDIISHPQSAKQQLVENCFLSYLLSWKLTALLYI